jgi:cytochrome c oxidase cbb3-type subunit 3
MKKRSEFIAALLFTCLGIWGTAVRPATAQAPAAAPAPAVDQAAADRGQGIFSSSCSFCHVAFLHARIQQVRGTRLPETALLVGDPKAGLAYFNGAGKCSTCHSPTGDLAHIGTKDQPLALTTSFLTPPAKPSQVTVVLPSGQTVQGKLEYLDEFTVSLVDDAGVYHTWPRDRTKSVTVVDPLAAHKALLTMYTDKDIHDLLAYLVTLK